MRGGPQIIFALSTYLNPFSFIEPWVFSNARTQGEAAQRDVIIEVLKEFRPGCMIVTASCLESGTRFL